MVANLPPLRSVSLRFLLAAVILLPIMRLRRSRMPTGREWPMLLLVSTLMMALPFSLTAWAEQWIGSGKTSILFTLSPLMTAAAELWILPTGERRPLARSTLAGLLLGLAGAGLVLRHSISHLEGRGGGVILLVVTLGSVATVLAKQWLRDIPVLTVTAISTSVAGLTLGALSLLLESGRRSEWTRSSVAAILFLGIFSSAAGFLLYYWLLQEMAPHQLAARYFLMPLVALVEASLYLHEPISSTMIVGTTAVLVGLVLVLRNSRPQRAQPAADRRI